VLWLAAGLRPLTCWALRQKADFFGGYLRWPWYEGVIFAVIQVF
jgi:hypothetical protein